MSARTLTLSRALLIDLTLILGVKLKALVPRSELASYVIFRALQTTVAYFMITDS